MKRSERATYQRRTDAVRKPITKPVRMSSAATMAVSEGDWFRVSIG